MARPKIQIDEQQVFKLAKLQCTNEEIAQFFNVNRDTISDRFSAVILKGREVGRTSLRRAQFKHAIKGNPTLLIWLGKQYLGQTEKLEKEKEADLINQELDFSDVPLNGDGEHRFSKFIN